MKTVNPKILVENDIVEFTESRGGEFDFIDSVDHYVVTSDPKVDSTGTIHVQMRPVGGPTFERDVRRFDSSDSIDLIGHSG